MLLGPVPKCALVLMRINQEMMNKIAGQLFQCTINYVDDIFCEENRIFTIVVQID